MSQSRWRTKSHSGRRTAAGSRQPAAGAAPDRWAPGGAGPARGPEIESSGGPVRAARLDRRAPRRPGRLGGARADGKQSGNTRQHNSIPGHWVPAGPAGGAGRDANRERLAICWPIGAGAPFECAQISTRPSDRPGSPRAASRPRRQAWQDARGPLTSGRAPKSRQQTIGWLTPARKTPATAEQARARRGPWLPAARHQAPPVREFSKFQPALGQLGPINRCTRLVASNLGANCGRNQTRAEDCSLSGAPSWPQIPRRRRAPVSRPSGWHATWPADQRALAAPRQRASEPGGRPRACGQAGLSGGVSLAKRAG